MAVQRRSGAAATLALLLAGAAQAAVFVEDEALQSAAWEGYKRAYGRSYETADEEAARFETFLDNLRLADARNEEERAAAGNAVHGITRFSDLTQAEFRAKFTTSRPPAPGKHEVAADDDALLGDAPIVADWTGKMTTPVKDQGACGSCWAFSAVEQIESDAMRTLGLSVLLSPQQVVSCDYTSFGCSGGWTEHAYDYVTDVGGIESEASLPYTSYNGMTGTCASTPSEYLVSVSGYETVSGENAMAKYVGGTGPLSVCVDASRWSTYTDGVMKECGTNINHCVQAVGVDTGAGYWLVRNSWGTDWGEGGFIRLEFGQDTCGLTSDPTYAEVTKTQTSKAQA